MVGYGFAIDLKEDHGTPNGFGRRTLFTPSSCGSGSQCYFEHLVQEVRVMVHGGNQTRPSGFGWLVALIVARFVWTIDYCINCADSYKLTVALTVALVHGLGSCIDCFSA